MTDTFRVGEKMRKVRNLSLCLFLSSASLNAAASCYTELKKTLPDSGVIVFGEYHGTVEAPRFFLDCIREFGAKKEKISVFLELPVTENPSLSSYGAGRIGERTLVQSSQWKIEDGRTSVAMLELLRALRTDLAAGRVVNVTGIDQANGGDYAVRDRDMADNFMKAYRGQGYSMVLVGNLHAKLTQGVPWNPNLKPFAMYVREKIGRMVSLDLRYGAGTAWSCTPKCGPASIGEHLAGVTLPAVPSVALKRTDAAYDGTWYVGPLNASPPAWLRFQK